MAWTNQQVGDEIFRNGWAGNGQPINASAIYSAAQQYGVPASQLDQVGAERGWWGGGDATNWVMSKGLGGGLGTQAPAAPSGNPYLQINGTPTMNNSPASPYTAPSTTGSTPAVMTGGGNGAYGTPSEMVAAPSGNPYGQGGQQRNPYMPAGGPGSNYGSDPRIGGPGGRPSGMAGLARYLSDNPHMLAMGSEITRGVNNNLQRNVLPGIRGNAMAAGTVGGSRQGVAEGLATGEAMSGLAGALANLYGNQFNQDRGYGLQNDALDFQIHRGNLSDMRTGQLDQMNFLGQMANLNQQGIGAATQTRDRPFTDWNRFVSPASQMAGLGGSQTQNLQGNPWLGAMGGYMAGSRMFGG